MNQTELTNPQLISEDEREHQMDTWTRSALDQRQGVGVPRFHNVAMTKRDWAVQEAIAQQRIHTAGRQRRRNVFKTDPTKLDPHQIGVFGEYIFAKALGIESSEIFVSGMSQDYAFKWDIGTVAVKTTLHIDGKLAMKGHKSDPPRADFFILCSKLPGNRLGGSIDGFCTRDEWMLGRVTQNDNVDWPYYTYRMQSLRPFYEFVLLLIARNARYIPLAQDGERQRNLAA